MLKQTSILATTLAILAGLVSSPADARRPSGIRNTSHCTTGGCYSHKRASGFYRQKLNSDGGIAGRSADGIRFSRRSRY